MHRIEKQMCAHHHVRLGHGSKDTAHVRVGTSVKKRGMAAELFIKRSDDL